jgi:hypothetical protein
VKINEIFGGQRPSEFNASDYTADQLKGYKVDKSGKLVKDVSGGQMRKDVRTGIGNQIAGYFGRGKSEPTWNDKRDDLYKQALEQKDQAFLTSIDSKIAKGEKITPQEKAQADTIRAKLKQAPLPDDVVEPAPASPPITPPEGTVVQVMGPGGQEYFKSYKNVWYMKLGGPNEYGITHPITDPVSVGALDQLADQSGKKIPVVPDPTIPNMFVLDRRARNAAIRASRKQRMSK